MPHEPWFELISAAVDDQLVGDEPSRLEAHLETCPECRQLVEQLDRDRRLVRLHQPTADRGPLIEAVLADRAAGQTQGTRARARLLRRGGVAAGLVAAAMIAVVSFARNPEPAPAPAPELARGQVLIDARSHAFEHANVEVSAGTTVEWRNAGATRHHLVRALGGATITEDLLPGRTESARFSTPGIYRFYCTIHPEMTGSVTVDA